MHDSAELTTKTGSALDASPAGADASRAADSPVHHEDALNSGTALQHGALVLGEVLNQSHFGITYGGLDKHLQRTVAIKEFFPDGCARDGLAVEPHGVLSPEAFGVARDQFLDEARTLARFRHPNIVHVYSFFEENNTAYMVMEYIEGETLLETVARRGRLSEAEAIHYIQQAGEALEEVHRASLLHCDVKPDNLILRQSVAGLPAESQGSVFGRVVLVDFGLSTPLEDAGTYLTRPLSAGGNFGTPGYAPLEQYTQHVSFGAYTDIYALGATLYHLLSGTPPTPAPDRAYGEEMATLADRFPDISPGVIDAVQWALELRAELRPQTVRAWLGRLQASHANPSPVGLLTDNAVSTDANRQRIPAPPTRSSHAGAHVTSPIGSGQLPNTQSSEPDEKGCLEATFAGCITVWAAALIVYLIGFFIHVAMVAGR